MIHTILNNQYTTLAFMAAVGISALMFGIGCLFKRLEAAERELESGRK